MKLKSELIVIAALYRIEPEKLVLDEIDSFQKVHRGHGCAQIQIERGSGILTSIYLRCPAYTLKDITTCPHHDPNTDQSLKHSLIYSMNQSNRDLETQRRRRKGEIDYQCNSIPQFSE